MDKQEKFIYYSMWGVAIGLAALFIYMMYSI